LSGFVAGAAAAGLVPGVLSGLFGIGGGIVLVPLLGLLLGLGQHDAQGVTLAVLLLPVGLPALLAYARRVRIRWGLVAGVVAGFVAGVAAGAAVANRIPERPLRFTFVAFLAIVAVQGWRRAGSAGRAGGEAAAPASDWNGLWVGAVGGAFAGLLGVGGGIVMVPMLAGGVGLDQHEAQGTTLAAMLPPIGLPGVLVYAREQTFQWPLVATVAIAYAVGSFLGARYAARARTAGLGRAFSAFVLCVAAALAWSALRS